MENQRLILFVALALVVFMLYSAWQEQVAPRPTPSAGAPIPGQTAVPSDQSGAPPIPSADVPTARPATAAPAPAATPGLSDSGALVQAQRVRVVTDLLEVDIDTTGGDLRRVALRTYPEKLNDPDKPVVLFNDTAPRILIAQSGLVASAGQSADHHAPFRSAQPAYKLAAAEDKINVSLSWLGSDGFGVNKIYTFYRNSYVIDLAVEVINHTRQDWSGRFYRQLQRSDVTAQEQSRFIYTYTGGIVSNELTKYEKVALEDMATWKAEQNFIKGGWIAMIQHYFIGAWIPRQDEYNYFYTKALPNGRYLIGISTDDIKVAAGQTGTLSSSLYIGPKEQDRLAQVAPNLQLAVDYGVLTILADPLFWLLDFIHEYVNNWGWAIILVTLIIKLVFYKLSEAAYRSMAKMRKFQPKIVALRERYGNDRQRMSQAMMELYKKEKINPLGGCLPMLVQIPVFIALYWVLLESVELRQAPFILWIDDLSAKDPYFVLPVIMGISMFIQQKLNPAPMDPMQAKILSFLPLVFTLFFAFFPSGLVLYWVANNILSIVQQWAITRKIERAAA
ncbi:MAG TPA: membrane protein insertase YidC [Gammaproteobacteria bacterium]